ncbi:hypothetical protein [Accumulibacter sp.]|uniref:Uncharacterized protein n=1 Tax=Accumulibacter regalis TaxID=522306 RepID=C7RUJ2_ACCRE|nr:hypothetical protein [Accumulibacter sp.]MBN8499236.1 hypothetical protein [Accumulibacter sp.]
MSSRKNQLTKQYREALANHDRAQIRVMLMPAPDQAAGVGVAADRDRDDRWHASSV